MSRRVNWPECLVSKGKFLDYTLVSEDAIFLKIFPCFRNLGRNWISKLSKWGNKKSKFENIDARIDDKACIERLNVRKKNRMKNFVIQFDFNFLETIETNKIFRKFNSIDY